VYSRAYIPSQIGRTREVTSRRRGGRHDGLYVQVASVKVRTYLRL
jgi:hypothetical protein